MGRHIGHLLPFRQAVRQSYSGRGTYVLYTRESNGLPLPHPQVVPRAPLRDKKRPPGRLEVSGGTALAACMSPEESIPAEARAPPKARSKHNCSGTRWKQSMTTDFYVGPPRFHYNPRCLTLTLSAGLARRWASARSRLCCGSNRGGTGYAERKRTVRPPIELTATLTATGVRVGVQWRRDAALLDSMVRASEGEGPTSQTVCRGFESRQGPHAESGPASSPLAENEDRGW